MSLWCSLTLISRHCTGSSVQATSLALERYIHLHHFTSATKEVDCQGIVIARCGEKKLEILVPKKVHLR